MYVAAYAITPKTRRRWFQCTIRRLFVLVTIFSIPFALWASKKHQYETKWHVDLEAISGFTEAGGSLVGGRGDVDFGNADPKWVRRLINDRYLEYVVALVFEGNCSDSNLHQISRTENLNIETVQINDCPVSGDGLAYLADFRRLSMVKLYGNQFTNDDLKHLLMIPKLNGLRLVGEHFDNQALHTIGKMTDLEGLWFCDLQLNDDGLHKLQPLNRLKWLGFMNIRLTDAGLVHLAALTELEELELFNTQVTEEGVARLRAELPGCEISHYNDKER